MEFIDKTSGSSPSSMAEGQGKWNIVYYKPGQGEHAGKIVSTSSVPINENWWQRNKAAHYFEILGT